MTIGSTSSASRETTGSRRETTRATRKPGRRRTATLVAAALDDVRARGLRLVALCPFTAAYVRGHREYDDLVDPLTPRLKADLRAAQLI